jgi:hypothetical protein
MYPASKYEHGLIMDASMANPRYHGNPISRLLNKPIFEQISLAKLA